MKLCKFDVIVIGGGPAGVAAGGALAKAGLSVALLEAGVYAGAENWSGCVYFTETLAHPDCFGPEAVAAAPFERRVVRRGTLMHNGMDVIGLELTDPAAFQSCYTVLRPVYDPYFVHLVRLNGAVVLAETTVTSLIRKDGRVVGVDTNRGPLYADLTFLAEGDASHLVRSERLERVRKPHFLQGIKAVLSLTPEEIEKRFRLGSGEGAAYELLIRNASIAGRTAKLNVGGFLYTNRDSLSVGCVVPLDNVRNNYRGNHDHLLEWMRGLPYVRELLDGAVLSSYGTKIIRSGGWRERPKLVEDGLVVGGAAAGLGVDIPFPNFTGPAAATGLQFARAAKALLGHGRAPNAKNLEKEYSSPLRESIYGKNAQYLSQWPNYFGKSKVLFGRTVDIACGVSHFLSSRDIIETGRFLRNHLLSLRSIRESITDGVRAIGSLRLWKPIFASTVNASTFWSWFVNLFKKTPAPDGKLGFIMRIAGRDIDATTLSWPIGPLIGRLSPSLRLALTEVYANDGLPVRLKFAKAIRYVLRGMKLTDLIVLPAYGLLLFGLSIGTAVWDAFRYYVLKTPVEKLLAEPVMAYNDSLRKARDLDAVKPSLSLEAKLAANTYRIGGQPHIRTLWPESITSQPDMSQAGLWWVCPARVYVYDAPPFAGRGRVTVNFENCIKCESCWRSEPARVLWGRHTDHKLIYRPASDAMASLIESLRVPSGSQPSPTPTLLDESLWYVSEEVARASRAVVNASAAFTDSIAKLPASANTSRRAWPAALGKRLEEKLARLETALANDGRSGPANLVRSELTELSRQRSEGDLFPALYRARRFGQQLKAWMADTDGPRPQVAHPATKQDRAFFRDDASALFPDRIVKQWEEEPLSGEWAEKLLGFIADHRDTPRETVRALSFISPALGLIAARQLEAISLRTQAGFTPSRGAVAVFADGLHIHESGDGVQIEGMLHLVPLAAADALFVISNGRGYFVPLSSPGIAVTPTPAIGFRAAGLSDIVLNCTVPPKYVIPTAENRGVPDAMSYLAIALGAADYLCKRVKEHAAGRVQFPGQMLDTEGRDGIAKLGAVKALIGRTEAWRLLLETLSQGVPLSGANVSFSPEELGLLCASAASIAFSPEPGAMGYDAGQVFGGFAYSEDDLLSRSYRDSSLYRFLAPGFEASVKLNTLLDTEKLTDVLSRLSGSSGGHGTPLGPLMSRLAAVIKQCAGLSSSADASLAGGAKAVALAIREVLMAAERGLNEGRSMETEAAALEVLLGLAEDAVQKAELSAGRGSVPPSAVFPVEPSGNEVTQNDYYEAFCTAAGAPHTSGSFLTVPFDRSVRFVPEMQLHDANLHARWRELAGWFRKNCRDKQFDGMHIERYIEKIHRLPDEVVRAAKENKWLATYIPRSEDGLGWRKAEYYILNGAAGSFGDAGIDLLIMASTSIGTTPILLGLEEELPRVREELEPLIRDEQKLGEIGSRLAKIVRTLANPNPGWIKKEYEAVMKLVDERIRRTRVVKYLSANFLRAFYGAGIAGRRGDFGGFIANLKRANELFGKLMPDVRAALDELPRRERCHKLFLRYLGHGGVSAFALTEPTAGSDSGGVKTTARLTSAKLSPLDDGRYSFALNDGNEMDIRYLIDADKIVFTDQGIAYRAPDGQAAAIRYDRYDYATDQGVRYFTYQGKECPFHDIGQVRNSDRGPVYEYYIVTGAKMWITNGSISTQMCLYAQTPEGVTGFMVDRHAEGLKVGADEKKTGQRGSPTNEISIDSARVPREAVIGYEGHGQVNALETLNVGRCGLAVVSGALMRKLMREAAKAIPPSPGRDKILGEAAAVLFGSESLAYYLVGLFDRPHESVRMESAIAKFACSEDIHELLSLVEYAFGPAGQTEKFLLEKARRDSRILTIYEGTNEVQRFLILKDLIAQAANWPEISGQQTDEPDRILASWKTALRSHVKAAAGLLGDTSWSDAMLQPALFPLAEMAGEILKLECVFYRREWLNAQNPLLAQSSPVDMSGMLAAANRSVERTIHRLERLDEKFKDAWTRIKNNEDMPEVRVADAALDQLAATPFLRQETPPEAIGARIRALAIMRPVADLSPRPRIEDGEIRELVWKIDPTDLSGLSQLITLKTASGSCVIVDVLMAGGPEHDELLRMSAGVRADGLYRLAIDPAAEPGAYLKVVQNLEALQHYDLIVTGAECLNGDRSLGPYLAGGLKRSHYQKEVIETKPEGAGLDHVVLPAVISITSASSPPIMNMTGAVQSFFSPIGIQETERPSSARFDLPVAAETAGRIMNNVGQVVEYLTTFAASASASAAPDFTGKPMIGGLSAGDVLWAILDPRAPKSNAAVLRGAHHAADLLGKDLYAVIPAPRPDWPALLGLSRVQGCARVFCLDTKDGRLSNNGKQELLKAILQKSSAAVAFAGTEWDGSFASMAAEANAASGKAVLCSGVTGIAQEDGGLVFSLPAYEGKLIRRHAMKSGPAFITTTAEADFPVPTGREDFAAVALDLMLSADWIMPLPPAEEPTLSQAEVIIDLGYGIRDKAGYELAGELKNKLEAMGLVPMFGATRKVTQDLKLLPLEAQIGQTGVRVNPKLIIALGISGAPQHIDYIGTRAEVLCFNKDTEAPLMKLNQTRSFPHVHPIAGDLFVTVRELIEKLK